MDERAKPTSPNTDPRSGFNRASRTFYSLRPPLHLPPPHAAVSAATYVFSVRRKSTFPDYSTAYIDAATGRRLSSGEFIHRVETLAANLTAVFKLSKGDTALILSPNLIQVPILHFALLSAGVVVTPANPLSTRYELTRVFTIAKPAILFTVTSVAEKTREFNVKTILLDSSEFDSLTHTPSNPPSGLGMQVTQSDVALILFSSGTTGMVKGVELTHRNLTAIASLTNANPLDREHPSVTLVTVPFFHVFGFLINFRAVMTADTVVVLERFSLTAMLGAVERLRVTHVTVAPALVVAVTKGSVTDGYDLGSLEGIVCGGALLAKETAIAFKSKFPNVCIIQGYGLTESAVTRTTPEEANRVGTVGRLIPNVEAKIVNPKTGEAMFPGEPGELWIRGPYVMKGYAGDPEATSATLVNGWLRTGDLCYFDNEGYLYVIDRLKELIKYKGYQVAPAELEELLLSHPEIGDAAVIPYPDELAGQIPMAFVVRQPQSSLTAAEIMDFVAKRVTPYKKIRRVAFIDSIPKNAAGKILRKDLRKVALSRL
ncbi:hypothetical protein VNO78_33529 [Psophocarpus tetragonolobus]|uniref:4-coumarate--CoA ligase n=1 Tax=Psophocarpus tetragonolobus TaxID=3891 RepID=A0AAN9RPS0_PSOTE